MALRVTHADRPFLGYDLSSLPPELHPMEVVDAERMAADNIENLFPDTSPTGKPPGMMAVKGSVPVYLGQPVALLIFDNAAIYRQAFQRLQFQPGVIEYGEPVKVPPVKQPYQPPTFLTRYVEHGSRGGFSQVQDGQTNPFRPSTFAQGLGGQSRSQAHSRGGTGAGRGGELDDFLRPVRYAGSGSNVHGTGSRYRVARR